MGKRQTEIVEMRYYEVAPTEYMIALTGEEWRRVYGEERRILHIHNLMEIGLHHEGDGVMWYEQKDLAYRDCEQVISVIPKNFPHTTHGQNMNFWEYLFFDPEKILKEYYAEDEMFCNKVLKALNRKALLIHKNEEEDLYQLVELIISEYQGKRNFYSQSLKALLLSLIFKIVRLQSNEKVMPPVSEDVKRYQILPALEYINANYTKPIRIQELSEVCHISESHFRRKFKEMMNISPGEYITMVRVQAACEMMKQTNYSMETISYKAGFGTISSFNRSFHQLMGVSPYQWKKHPDNYESRLLGKHVTIRQGWEF